MTPRRQANDLPDPAIGIDLGTTYSAVAHVDEMGKPYTITNQVGDLLTPTAVLIDDNDIVVGREAINAAALEPESYADCFKRDVGSPVFRRGLSGVQVPPQVLSALVLDQLKRDAERRLGPIKQAVITVPAFFDEARRKATQDAGRLAGLEVLDIINEPTAAALAYGHQQGLLDLDAGESRSQTPTRALVYDLGGGTFDVTILEVSGTTFRALATDGDVRLGGKDFDERIVEFLAERFIEDHGIDPRIDPQDAAQLWADAQKVKHALTQRSKTSTVLFHAGVRSSVVLTRDDFEQMTCDLLERTETTTSLVVREAGLTWDDIDRILLVGGSSRMPAVTAMLTKLTGKEVDRSLSPDEAVAHGAALHAAMLTRTENAEFAQCQLINVNSHSLGVRGIDNRTGRKVNAIMIPKNTPLPCKQARSFTTIEDDQRSVKVVVLEGESHRPDDCIQLGDCVIRDLPPGLAKGSNIEVTYRYASNGRVSVSARMPQTRQSARVEIERTNAVELEDLESWRKRLLGRQSGESDSPSDDAGAVLRRLDELYASIGNEVLLGAVPEGMQRSQAAAKKAMASFHAADSAYQQAESARVACASRAELMQTSAGHVRTRAKLEQTHAQAKFACIVLGRDCVKQGHAPPVVAELVAEAQRLRAKHIA